MKCVRALSRAWAFGWPGKIVQRQAELGQRVRAGQVLAQLDPQDYAVGIGCRRRPRCLRRKRSTIWRRPTSSGLRP